MSPAKKSKKEHRTDEKFEIQLSLENKTRTEFRKEIVNTFLSEKAGYWKDGIKYVTHYKYFVETIEDSRRVYLLRPTYLNKGIDFQVWVEKFDGIEDKRPSHNDVLNDLKLKYSENKGEYKKLFEAVRGIYSCNEPLAALENVGNPRFKKGMPPELLLKILKWLFIEQDVTYWNYDGRTMLFNEILKISGEKPITTT